MERKVDIQESQIINKEQINSYKDYLYQEEKSINTIKKYIHDINSS